MCLLAQLQADPKKQGKEKKPDENLVSLVFPGAVRKNRMDTSGLTRKNGKPVFYYNYLQMKR